MSLAPDTARSADGLETMLADPEIRHSLAVIVANAPALAALVAMGTELLQRGPELTDNINGIVRQMRAVGQTGKAGQLGTAVGALVELAPIAETLATRSETIQGLLDSSILRPEIVKVVGNLGEAALEADRHVRGKAVEVGGVFAIMRQLKDPAVQETLAYLMEFAKAFGARQSASQ